MSTLTRPDWHYDVPQSRQGHWVSTDSKWRISDGAGYGEPVRVVLKDGTVIDGIMHEERNRWDGKHAFAVARIAGRKSRRWILVKDVAIIWGDKGRPIEELLTAVLKLKH